MRAAGLARRRPLDVAIVGAGPAGLAAACALREARPALRVAVLDRGVFRSPRDATPAGLVQGVGGAGLWSDGKFSWAPAATRLWELSNDGGALERAYDSVAARVRAVAPASAPIPPFPGSRARSASASVASPPAPPAAEWRLKRYPSLYLSLDRREALIDGMVADAAPCRFVLGARVDRAAWSPRRRAFSLTLSRAERRGRRGPRRLSARSLIVAGGRFWPLQHGRDAIGGLARSSSGRFEYGVRLEAAASNAFFTRTTRGVVDPKLTRAAGLKKWVLLRDDALDLADG